MGALAAALLISTSLVPAGWTGGAAWAQSTNGPSDGRPNAIQGVVPGEGATGETDTAETTPAETTRPETARAAAVAVTRVTLATGGLAQVEGRMAGPASAMNLAIERPQVADVLRTLLVTGPAPVVSIDLEAAEPVGARSATGRLLAGNLADPTTILTALIGKEVTLSGGPRTLSGTLLAFSPVTVPGSDQTPEKPGLRAAVATPAGEVAFAVFPSLEHIAIEGPALAEAMAELIPALGESVDDGRRDLTVRLAEPAEAGFSFVVPTTVWRPSYRAVIGEGGKVNLQGWATLENTTGLDWTGIDLRLAVGTPVAYSQDVYSPLRTRRPDAPFEVGRTAETGIVAAEETAQFAAAAPPRADAGRMFRRGPSAEAAPMPVADLVTGAPAEAGTAATIFPVAGAIDLAAGRTLTVPFLSGEEDISRITYLDLIGGAQPFDSLEMTFDAEATVPGGLIAVYDQDGFVGDARFGGADGGEPRILPFAVSADLKATTQSRTNRTLTTASLRGGSLVIRRSEVETTTLTVAAAEDTTLVTDIARLGNDTVSATGEGLSPEVVTIDEGRARIRVALPAGQHTLTVTAERPIMERYLLASLPAPVIEEVLSSGGAIDADTRERLEGIRALTAEIAGIDRTIAQREQEIDALRRAVEFDRDNLEAIDASTPEGAEVRRRIISRTGEIDAAMAEVSDLSRRRAEVEQRLSAN
ncbi:hypothetical protein ATO13_18370 [Stappia sp. 22II-S9-Z10]|nr:hypothetical protein ATO13_18370 [Stappia sp. 22II-S9-Z10]